VFLLAAATTGGNANGEIDWKDVRLFSALTFFCNQTNE
jgi:hypothetical protein